LILQQHVREGKLSLVWSYILDYENSLNPFADRRESIKLWRSHAQTYVAESERVITKARALTLRGVKPFDALHVSCAIEANAVMFVSTDDGLLRKVKTSNEIHALFPGEALAQAENWYENRS
jgi:hypothetical protein